MSEIIDYKNEFIIRTKEILEDNYCMFAQQDREVTFLLNCLLGLVVTICENEKNKTEVFKGKIDAAFASIIPDTFGFICVGDNTDVDLTLGICTEVGIKIGHKDQLLGKKDKLWFIKNIRNGIAHQNVHGVNVDGLWTGVRLWNRPRNGNKNFEVVFTIEELRSFALKLSEWYLNREE